VSKVIPLGLVLSLLLSGCYFNESVSENQVGIRLSGGQIVDIVGAGVHTDLGWFASLEQVSRNPLDFTVEDAQVLTRNRQAVGIKLNVKIARPTQPERVTDLWRNFNNLAVDDAAIPIVMDGPTRQAIKANVAQFTLDDLIVDRNGLRDAISAELDARADQYRLDVLSVDVADVVIDQKYTDELQNRQLIEQQRVTAESQRRLIEQQTGNERFKVEQDALTQKAEAEKNKAIALVQAQQRLEVARVDAESRRQSADAENYYISKRAAVITPEYVAQTEAERWDGRLPQTVFGGSGPIPVLDLAEPPDQP
jgi:hypothetical protein